MTRRSKARFLLILLLAASVLPGALSIAHAQHDCPHAACPICLLLESASDFPVCPPVFLLSALLSAALPHVLSAVCPQALPPGLTPVMRRDRMLN